MGNGHRVVAEERSWGCSPSWAAEIVIVAHRGAMTERRPLGRKHPDHEHEADRADRAWDWCYRLIVRGRTGGRTSVHILGLRLGLVSRHYAFDLLKSVSFGGAEQTVVSDLVEAFWQHMLEEPADELGSGQRHGIPAGVAGILVAEGHISLINGHDAVVGDGNPVDVTSEIGEYFVCSLDGGFAVDDPLFVPDFLGELFVWEGSAC